MGVLSAIMFFLPKYSYILVQKRYCKPFFVYFLNGKWSAIRVEARDGSDA